jgi:hypothetical protein
MRVCPANAGRYVEFGGSVSTEVPGVVVSGGCVVSVSSPPFEHEMAMRIDPAINKNIYFFIRDRLG